VKKLRVAADVGGTFTDICVFDEADGQLRVAKVPSTPNPIDGVLAGVAKAGVDLSTVALFAHGTTVATNALITRNLPAAAMVTTKGFRDVLEIRRGTKEDLWDPYKDVSPPYIKRRHRLEVGERIGYDGELLEPLDEDDVREVAGQLRDLGVKTVAVCFVNSFANPVNEQRAREILEEHLPGVSVSTSSEVLPEIFEYERFSTTVANAVLSPLVVGYTTELAERLEEDGYDGDLLLLHSGGGVMTPRMVERYAVRLAASGIAAGAIAAQHVATLAGFPNAIGFDMGGTSTDVSLIWENEVRVTKEWSVEYGHPLCFPSIEVLTIGAGGGSLAWIDEGGSLRMGPQSAGSRPGPACYGQGGQQATNTDANLVLGRLGTELVGGAMTLDPELAEQAIQKHVAEPLGLSLFDAAAAMIGIANANMADAIRLVSVRRGYDPRDFALVVFGGGGGLHGAALAKDLSIPTALVPPNPGITSALGCLLVDVRHDLASMFLRDASKVRIEEIEAEFQRLEAEGLQRLQTENIPDDQIRLNRSIDMRYLGQWRSLAVPVGKPLTELEPVIEAFHQLHGREHNFSMEDAPVEIFRLNLTAIGVTEKPSLPRAEKQSGTPAPRTERQVWFDETREKVPTPIYLREDLKPGNVVTGPAVIEQLDTTVLVPPGVPAEVDEWGFLRIQVAGQ
jgi:N-methylhydantoinase A